MRRKKVKPQISKSLLQGTGQLKDSKYESHRPTPILEDRIAKSKLKHSTNDFGVEYLQQPDK
jgi:hypothetical protein